jgi:putative tricarboxylic transport membrane protein
MLAAIYYGSQYGGTITSVLINVPGEASSAVTCIDGYQMAKNGRAGAAIAIAAIGSFVGGTIGVMGVAAAAPLTQFALQFGPVEFVGLMVLGLTLVSGLAGKSMVKALMAAAFGLMLGTVGMDPAQGAPRIGNKAPEFTLADASGKATSLAELLTTPVNVTNTAKPRGVLLIFYRGYW